MFRWENLTSHLVRMKNSSYYIAPVGDWTHDLPHTVASNMVNMSHALNHSAMNAVRHKGSTSVISVRVCIVFSFALFNWLSENRKNEHYIRFSFL